MYLNSLTTCISLPFTSSKHFFFFLGIAAACQTSTVSTYKCKVFKHVDESPTVVTLSTYICVAPAIVLEIACLLSNLCDLNIFKETSKTSIKFNFYRFSAIAGCIFSFMHYTYTIISLLSFLYLPVTAFYILQVLGIRDKFQFHIYLVNDASP